MCGRTFPTEASVVVVGGGVIGTSIAFHLAEAGVEDVVLLERAELASGSTSKAAGGVRAQFSDELNIRIGLRSLEVYERFRERPGWEIDLHQAGYLFLLTRDEDVDAFGAALELQHRLGVPTAWLTPRQAREVCPPIETGDLLAATYSPRDGYAVPEAVVQGFASGARRHGATLVTHCAVEAIEVVDNTVVAVHTARGAIATDTVICAAGAWSPIIGAMVGVALPVEPLRRAVVFTEPLDPPRPERLPLTIDFANGFYFHSEGPGLIMGMPDPGVGPGWVTEASDRWEDALYAAIERRVPSILELGLRGGWAGYHEMTPDCNALIGEASGVSRFLYATGFSGHGFLQGPAVGEIVADLVLGRRPFVDVAPLSAERFADGAEVRPERYVI